MSQKQSISAGEIYSTICVELVADHFDLGLTLIDLLSMKICAENDLYLFSFPLTLTFDL